MKKPYSIILAICTSLSSQAIAGEGTLKKEEIVKLYKDIVHSQTLEINEQVSLLEKHLGTNGQFIFNSKTDMSAFGIPTQQQNIQMTKQQAIDSTVTGAQTMTIMEAYSSPQNIQLSTDGKTATLTDHNKAYAVGDLPTPNGTISVKISINGYCNDEVSLNKSTIIIDKSVCDITTVITPVSNEL